MPTLADDFTTYLATAAGLHPGVDLFAEQAPELETPLTVVRSTGGPSAELGPVMPATLQILTRAKDYAAASSRAQAIFDLLYPPPRRQSLRNLTLTHFRALVAEALQAPTYLGASDAGQHQWAFNLAVRYVNRPVQH